MSALTTLALITSLVSISSGETSYFSASVSHAETGYSEKATSTVASKSNNLFDGFTFMGGFPEKVKILDFSYGYIYYDIQIYRTQFTSNSDLYLVGMQTEFTPGWVAYRNGNTNYGMNYILNNGYVHLEAIKYEESPTKKGGNVFLKAYWPTSTTFTTTVTSSTGLTLNMNQSVEAGVDLDGGVSLKATQTKGLSISFNRSVGVTYTDPYLSAQSSPTNPKQAQWNYKVTSNTAKKVTYYLQTYYLFEMDNTNVNAGDDAFSFYYKVFMENSALLGIRWNHSADVTIACFQ